VGWIGGAAQCVVDFLIDERCHSCGSRLRPDRDANAPQALARPLAVLKVGPLRVSTRVLCDGCAAAVRIWSEPVPLGLVRGAPAGGARAPMDAPPDLPLLAYPAFATDERLLLLIHLLKFRRREALAPWLARAMSEGLPRRAREAAGEAVVLVPVPMERAARARRGFNQAEGIAVELGRCWGAPVAARALVKRRRTRPQSSLGRDERVHNVRGAFAPGDESVRGCDAVVVDDLVTTGATAAACAATLVSAGASSVRVVCAGYRP
jgi:ComF family protein